MIALKWINYGYQAKTVCRIIGLSRATFYFNISTKEKVKKPSFKQDLGRKAPGFSINFENEKINDSDIKQLVLELVKDEGYNYGYRKIAHCLKKRHKLIINKKKVYRLCKELNILRPPWERKNKYPRRIARNRVVTGPDQLWQTDVKYGYIAGADRLFYILSFIDVFDRTIVGYHIGLNCVAKSAVSALKQSMLKRDLHGKNHNLVVRSDNGVQFTSIAFAEACEELNIEHERIPPKTPNMNAYIEAFHSILEDDCLSLFEFDDFDEAKEAVEKFIQFYNDVRIHSGIRYCSPNEYHEEFLKGLISPVEIHL